MEIKKKKKKKKFRLIKLTDLRLVNVKIKSNLYFRKKNVENICFVDLRVET